MAPGKSQSPASRNDSPELGSARAGSIRSRTIWAFDRVARWLALILVIVVSVLLIVPSLRPVSTDYRRGQIPGENITASVSFTMVDEARRKQTIETIEQSVEAVYLEDKRPADRVRKQLEDLLDEAERIRKRSKTNRVMQQAGALVDWARREHEVTLSSQVAQLVTSSVAREGGVAELRRSLSAALEGLYRDRSVVDDVARYRKFDSQKLVVLEHGGTAPSPDTLIEQGEVAEYLRERYFRAQGGMAAPDPAMRLMVPQLAEAYARPNLRYSRHASAERLEERKARVQPRRTFEKGQIIVRHDEYVSREHEEVLRHMDRAYAQTFYKRLLAIAFYAVLLSALVFYYVRQFRPDIRFDTRNVFLVALPVLLALFAGRVGLTVFESPRAASYAFPAGLIGMLAVILFDVRTAVLLVTVGCLAFSIPTGLDFKVFITALMGGYAAVTVLTSVQERKEVLKAGVVVGIVNAMVIMLANLIDDPNELEPRLLLWGMANGVLCGVFAMPALALFESLLGVVTDIRLLELTGLGHPLLERMEREAPGSYQHALNVTKLSEAAAKAIGGNFLLVRAGSLYHDVGKIVKPKYFGENQISLEEKSLHSKISPYMSAMVIKNHVKAGMEMARKYKLPQRIVDFIPQHHGTTIISYFYHEALKRFENSESTDPVRESDFRYPGPKPQSIETAIVMLADSVEATVTSRFTSLSVNEDELHLVVQRSVLSKFNDSQFDECDLTFRHLEEIRRSFVNTLLSRFHHRVAYPTTPALSGAAAPAPKRDRMEREEQAALVRSND